MAISVSKLSLIPQLFLSCISFLTLFHQPLAHGHLASLYDEGEAKPPLLPHSRESRVPLLHSQDPGMSVSRLLYLRHPSYTHKYLSNQRMLKFHNPQDSIIRELDQPSAEASFENFLTRFAASRNGEGESGDTLSKESPTFTPYISAQSVAESESLVLPRMNSTLPPAEVKGALSNMEKFFHHLRENLEALQNDEEEGEVGQDSNGSKKGTETDPSGSPEKDKDETSKYQFSSLPVEWKPRASGLLGLKKIRSFFPLAQNAESRVRLGTNLGLGRRR